MSPTAANSLAGAWRAYVPPDTRHRWPWKRPKAWMVMLAALLLAALVSILWAIPHFEKRLDASSRADLRAAGITTATMDLDWSYRNVSVTGQLPPGVSHEDVANVLRQTDASGVRKILLDLDEPLVIPDAEQSKPDDSAPQPDPAPPPALAVSAVSDGVSVELSGIVFSDEQRDSLVNAALSADGVININDNIEIVGDAEATDASNAQLAVFSDLLSYMGSRQVSFAEADLSENNLNYRIKARDRSSAAQIEQAVSVAMVDFQVTGEIDHVKTGEIDVSANLAEGQMTLSGMVLNEEQKRRVVFAAEDVMGGSDQIIDDMTVSNQEARIDGADKRVEQLASLISQLGGADSGEARLRADTLSLRAAAQSEQAAAAMRTVLTGAGDLGLVTEQDIYVVETTDVDTLSRDQLQQRFDALAKEIERTVVFESSTATLSASATAVLNEVATVVSDFPDLLIEIEGHTDSVGRSAVNNALSERRAQAVVDYLVSQTVQAERMMAVGYGERFPIGDNNTQEGRRQNRRVRFKAVNKFSTVPSEAQLNSESN